MGSWSHTRRFTNTGYEELGTRCTASAFYIHGTRCLACLICYTALIRRSYKDQYHLPSRSEYHAVVENFVAQSGRLHMDMDIHRSADYSDQEEICLLVSNIHQYDPYSRDGKPCHPSRGLKSTNEYPCTRSKTYSAASKGTYIVMLIGIACWSVHIHVICTWISCTVNASSVSYTARNRCLSIACWYISEDCMCADISKHVGLQHLEL